MQDKEYIIEKILNIYHNNIGWIIPDESTIKLIQSFIKDKSVLSIYSGLGYLERIICEPSSHSLFTTIEARETDIHKATGRKFTDIEIIDAVSAVEKYQDFELLLIIMPPCTDPYALKSIKKFKGDYVLLVCTSMFIDENFQELNKLKVKYIKSNLLVAEAPFEEARVLTINL